jgi:hypothetical protein
MAACNPATVENCCTNSVSNACANVSHAGAERAEPSGGCNGASFDLIGLYDGTNSVTTWTNWFSMDPSFSDCPTNTQTETLVPFPGKVEWVINNADDDEVASGGSSHATVEDVCGELTCIFTVLSDPGECGEYYSTDYSASTTSIVVKLTIPWVIEVNDLVANCDDPAGYPAGFVETAEEFEKDDDLHPITWSVCPGGLGDICISGDARVRVLMLEGTNIVESPCFSDSASDVKIKLEGQDYSEEPGDAVVTMTYGGCTAMATTTVVRVQLDKFTYNRADPHPEVEIIEITGLEPGGQATVTYKVLDDMLDKDLPELTDTFTVEENLGIYEYKTPDYANRLGNTGHDAIRYTVYDNDGQKAVRWSHADPSRKALVDTPALALMGIEIKDALAATPAEALGHLAPTPAFAGEVKIDGSRPSYLIDGVKILAKAPVPAYTNEVHAQVGNETILQTLHSAADDSAVVLEITGPRTVGVNDRFTVGGDSGTDPGDDAAENKAVTDPDFIELTLEGVPDCIVNGTVEWEVTEGVRLVSAPEAEQVGTTISHNFEGCAPGPDLLRVFVEGRKASDAIDDVTVTARVIVNGSEDNPRAFRGQTLEAEFKLTVTDLRWTGWKADDEGGRTDERTELLVCDLDLRPAVQISFPSVGSSVASGAPLLITGNAYSMLSVICDIRVNGQAVSQDQIQFMGTPVSSLTAESVRQLTDQPPPYFVSFTHVIESFSAESIVVEARGGIGPWPGRAERQISGTGKVRENLPSEPLYAPPSCMVSFFDQDWSFLYKTEVDHGGAGKGLVECYEKAGAQPDAGLFRLRQPVVFLDAYGHNAAIPGPGLMIHPVDGAASIDYHNEQTIGMRKLFPVDLQVVHSGDIVPDPIEWTTGAVLLAGHDNDGLLRVLNPEHADIPDDAVLTLTVKPYGDAPNPFDAFTPRSWDKSEFSSLPAEISLVSDTPGIAVFELELASEQYGLLGRDRVKVSVTQMEIVWTAETVSQDVVIKYAGQSELPPPHQGGPGEPGGVGGFGGPPVDSGFDQLSSPLSVSDYEFIPGDEFTDDRITLTLNSEVSDWSATYTLLASEPGSAVFADADDSIAVRRIASNDAMNDPKGEAVETVIISSMAFGATRSASLYRPHGANAFESERLNLTAVFAAELDPEAVDTVDIALLSSLMPAFPVGEPLVETGADTRVFQNAAGSLQLSILRMSDFGAEALNDVTVAITSERLNLHGSVVDLRATAPGNHTFSGEALRNQGQPGTGPGATRHLPLGAIWIPRIGVFKDDDSKSNQKVTFPDCWKETKIEATVSRFRGNNQKIYDKGSWLYFCKTSPVAPPPRADPEKQYFTLNPLHYFYIYDESLLPNITDVFSDITLPSWLPFLPDVLTFAQARVGDKFRASVCYGSIYDEIKVLAVELHIDADNNSINYYDPPDMKIEERSFRQLPGHPGKALFLNELDTDKDGIPDYFDGYNIDIHNQSQNGDGASAPFVPLIVEIPDDKTIDYNTATLEFTSGNPTGSVFSNPYYIHVGGNGTHSDPYSYSTGSGMIRLWTLDGSKARSMVSRGDSPSGDWVPQDTPIEICKLSPDDGKITLYIEAVGGSLDLGDVKIRVKLDPAMEEFPAFSAQLTDEVQATVFRIESVRPIAEDFVQGHAGKIMISTKHCTPETPNRVYTSAITTIAGTPAQHHKPDGSHDRNVTITAYIKPIPPAELEGFQDLTVYFEVTDPDDRSPYDGKIEPADPTNHWPNDNRDKRMQWNEGYPIGYESYQTSLSPRSSKASNLKIDEIERYAAETTLKPTDRCAGDNYQVRATLVAPNRENEEGRFDTQTGMHIPYEFHASTIKETIPLVSWKRVYIEQDHMYTKGATITAAATAGATELYVENASDFTLPFPRQVVVFWKDGGHISTIETSIQGKDGNTVTVPPISQAIPAYAGIRPQGHTATYALTTNYLAGAFGTQPQGEDGGAFIEFRAAATGNDNGVPKYHYLPGSANQLPSAEWVAYCAMWYDNLPDALNNVAYLLAANKSQNGPTGWESGGATVVFTQMGSGSLPMDVRFRNKTVVHEIGHRFGLGKNNGGAHSYIDTYSDKRSYSGAAYCVMNYNSFNDGQIDNPTQFSIQCLVEGSGTIFVDSLRTTRDK